MTDTTSRSRPTPSPLRHRPVLRPPQDIYSDAPDVDEVRKPSLLRRARPPRRRVIAAAAGAVAAGTAAALVAILVPDRHELPPPAHSTPPTTTTPAAFADGGPCRAGDDGAVVRGDGPGGTDTGPHAVLGFDYAYFVMRDAAAARTFVAPNAAVGPVERLQVGIATVPAGTQHCLSITADGPDRYRVDLTTRHDHDEPSSYRQIVTTTTTAGRVLITAINSAP
jgi:hypothetical protein